MATATTTAHPEDMGGMVGTGVLRHEVMTTGEAVVHFPQMRQEAESQLGSKIADRRR